MPVEPLPLPQLSPQPSDTFSRAQSLEINRRRRGRNIAMLVSLVALCVLFYAIAIVKLSGH